MTELYYAISNKETGEEVIRDHGNFENMDDFYSLMDFLYGYTSRDYHFVFSGREIERAGGML